MRRFVLSIVAVSVVVWAAITALDVARLGADRAAVMFGPWLGYSQAGITDDISMIAWLAAFLGMLAYPAAASFDARKLKLAAMVALVSLAGAFAITSSFIVGAPSWIFGSVDASMWCAGLACSTICLLGFAKVRGGAAVVRICAQAATLACAVLGIAMIYGAFMVEGLDRIMSLLFVGAFSGTVLTGVFHLSGAPKAAESAEGTTAWTCTSGPDSRMMCPHCGAVHLAPLGTVTCDKCGCVFEERVVSRPEAKNW